MLIIHVAIIANCCYNFLGDAEIIEKNTLNLLYTGYGGYCGCECTFTLRYNQDLPHYACFDFIGELEDYRETAVLNDKSLKSYILKMRLITNSDIKDFFTIDIYVTPENMRFKELKVGMKLTGMFQMQGEIAR